MNSNNSNSSTKFKILFWNSRSIMKRKNDLYNLLSDVDVFVCVEIWLKPKDAFKLPGFTTIRKDRSLSRGGGILFITRKSLVITELQNITKQTTEVELAGIRIENVSPPINIIACYRIPGNILMQTDWNSILDTTDQNVNSLLIGDFNAHNSKWNCKNTDANGDRLEHSIKGKHMFLHNTYNHAHKLPI